MARLQKTNLSQEEQRKTSAERIPASIELSYICGLGLCLSWIGTSGFMYSSGRTRRHFEPTYFQNWTVLCTTRQVDGQPFSWRGTSRWFSHNTHSYRKPSPNLPHLRTPSSSVLAYLEDISRINQQLTLFHILAKDLPLPWIFLLLSSFSAPCAIQVASDANYVITFDAQAPIT
jgi:hypothetical protein